MKGRGVYRVADLALELAPAALLNFAVAFAIATLFRQNGLAELAAAASVGGGIAAFLAAWYLLRRTGGAVRNFALPQFEGGDIAAGGSGTADEQPDLLLTDRLEACAEQQPPAGELLLDDIIERIGPDSRVVRLFDPQRMPTAGELQARIDRHLMAGTMPPAPNDATEALHEAIEELRRSLR